MTLDDRTPEPDRRRPEGWSARSPVPAAMLNPCLMALVIGRAASGYRRESNEFMPLALSFIVAPLVLHRGTREALPTRITSHVATWISRQPSIRAGFPIRAAALVQPVREGIRFGVREGILEVDHNGLESRGPTRTTDEPALSELLSRSTFVGRWMTKVDRPSTVFTLFGVTV